MYAVGLVLGVLLYPVLALYAWITKKRRQRWLRRRIFGEAASSAAHSRWAAVFASPEMSVVSSSSASGLPLGVENIVMRARSIEVTLKGGMDAMAEFAIASNPNVAGRLKLDPSARKEIFEYYRMLTPIGYANALRALLQMDYITDRLREIEVPTLLVCGDQDLSLGPMREIQKRIPQAKFALLAPASHFANRDQPEAFNLAVVEFLMSLG